MELSAALHKFVNAFQRSEMSIGKVEYTPAAPAPQSSMPLEGVLADYYKFLYVDTHAHVGGLFHFSLYAPADLLRLQYGWHWIKNENGETIEDPHWPRQWVVIADRNGDAIFVDTSTGAVHGSIQKQNMLLTDDLSQFFDVIAEGMSIEMDKYHFEAEDDDANITQEFLDDVHSLLQPRLGAVKSKNFYEFFFG
ncbi:hypothetical protein ACFFTM_23780 [Pseudoduganella plicata]|uniref:SMI1/KNR4 family protein n=1 Tax=Pseudoduganella plicata TaxID=321984 RepID=A0A4P7BHY8_9BURK|nr:hypothetical protein [Pseudoduganella plicata]QBQ37892.1 hypothetical protein E1742_18200 [Pseudoduganella plicata]GGZ10560.1 hypothetical protein GCM10007388_49970 [Pseudoduganella plicata]